MDSMNPIDSLVDYNRQQQMDEDLGNIAAGYEHTVVGCGGVGWWMAIMLGMMGAQHLTLIDGDKLEPTNLNRLPVPLRMHGQLKVHALKAQLRLLRPTMRITCLPQHLTPESVPATFADVRNRDMIVWDCTDDARIQIPLYQYMVSQRREHNYRKAGYDGWKVGSYENLNVWLPDNYAPGYTTTHANALTSAFSAIISIMARGLERHGDITIDIKKLIAEGGNDNAVIS
jgi:hypothetical protein